MGKGLKVRTWIILAVAVGVTVGGVVLIAVGPGGPAVVEETRQALRSEGFKTDLAEFDFSVPEEIRNRVALLTNHFAASRFRDVGGSMVMVGEKSAVVTWKQEDWPFVPKGSINPSNFTANDFWLHLDFVFQGERERIREAGMAVLSGPIRFHLIARKGNGLLLPHLAPFKYLARMFGVAAMYELHKGNQEAAWTNIMAATRMVTAWTPEPTEASALVRFACTEFAFNTVWQALKTEWPEERLARLQAEWESVDLLRNLPETAAYARASAVALCQNVRNQPVIRGLPLTELFRNPGAAWAQISDYRRRSSYQRYGSYEDERDLLLHFRDRELELRKALEAKSWAEMKVLPGVMNLVPFKSKYSSPMQVVINSKQISTGFRMLSDGQNAGGLLGRAAEAETRRRLVVTAIALERYRVRNGHYPGKLSELVPEFLSAVPMDFMDGEPLRYRLRGEAEYELYSVGFDGRDDGGIWRTGRSGGAIGSPSGGERRNSEMDLIWPRVATPEEIDDGRKEWREARKF